MHLYVNKKLLFLFEKKIPIKVVLTVTFSLSVRYVQPCVAQWWQAQVCGER